MKILSIETSFDETAAAVVEDGTKIISNVLASSHEMHEKYGGVVPEIAAREQLKCIIPVITEALTQAHRYSATDNHHIPSQSQDDINTLILYSTGVFPIIRLRHIIEHEIDAIAVTVGPGLIGSLLVGVETAKTIAFVTGKPIIPVNHVLAHMYANFLDLNRENSPRAKSRGNLIDFPAISLVVSGGHTELYLMKSIKDLTWLGGTLDDAAGECFDKTARLLGFGHGGGVAIQEAAQKYTVHNEQYKVKLPRPMIDDTSLNFSFSGLKTAVMREWKKYENQESFYKASPRNTARGGLEKNEIVANFAYEIQEAITDVLVEKTLRAAKLHNAKSILLSGGVAANQRLREKFSANLRSNEVTNLAFYAPPLQLCTDNAVMIAAAAYFRCASTDWHGITAQPDLSVEV